jgi:4-oxalmesaconate hydratase
MSSVSIRFRRSAPTVRGVDPLTGHDFDDTKRYLDKIDWLSAEDRAKIFSGNAA